MCFNRTGITTTVQKLLISIVQENNAHLQVKNGTKQKPFAVFTGVPQFQAKYSSARCLVCALCALAAHVTLV